MSVQSINTLTLYDQFFSREGVYNNKISGATGALLHRTATEHSRVPRGMGSI